MDNWFELGEEDRKTIFIQTSNQIGLTTTAVEKDFWVMISLKAIFQTKYAEHLVFKGGTSLSKAWGLIKRFSEDIDLAIDRNYLGFPGELSRKQVTKLRKQACSLVVGEFMEAFKRSLERLGAKDFEIDFVEFERSDTDPVALELRYKSLTDRNEYLQPKILIEISARSLREPFELRKMKSHISEVYPGAEFVDEEIEIPTVVPKRTFLEKIFLLHEEFQKTDESEIRSHRMTRHLYDLGKIIDTRHAEEALIDEQLYRTIVSHREMLTNITWVDYKKHSPKTIQFLPPKSVDKEWEKDYSAMAESMFQGDNESYEVLKSKLNAFNKRVNELPWEI